MSSLTNFEHLDFFTDSLGEELRAQLSSLGMPEDFIVRVRKEWSAEQANFRTQIRDNLAKEIEIQGALSLDLPSLLDLNKVPEHPEFAISISHCKSFGGFILADKPTLLGFDIENLDRVTDKTLKRVMTIAEKSAVQVPAAVTWVAKEAAFKSLQSEKSLKVIAEVATHSWQQISPSSYLYQVEESLPEAKGVVIVVADVAFGFYWLRKSGGET